MSQILITWTPPTTLPTTIPPNSGYNVFRAVAPGVPVGPPINSALIPIGTNEFTDTDVVGGEAYDYFVETVIDGVSSAPSVEATSNPVPLPQPDPPTNVTAVAS